MDYEKLRKGLDLNSLPPKNLVIETLQSLPFNHIVGRFFIYNNNLYHDDGTTFNMLSTANTLQNTSVITGNGSVTDYQRVLVNTTSSSITLTLPSSPATNAVIGFLDVSGTFSTNNLIIQRGSVSHNIMGDSSLTCDLDGTYIELQFVSNSWRLLDTPFPSIINNAVTNNVTITVDYTNGNDTTGDFGNSFATLQGAINWLSGVVIQRNVTVTISVNSNCGIRAESPIYFSHPQGMQVKINALNESAGVSVSSISYSTPTLTVNTSTAHNLTTGNYVTITSVSPSHYNLFGIVASTPTSTQFTITWVASLTIPAYSSGGTVIKQGNVFTFNNTNGFIIDGHLGELNIAVSQTGNLSGAEKIGVLLGGLKEVVESTNKYNGDAHLHKGKLYTTGFYIGVYTKLSSIYNTTVISNKSFLFGCYLVSSKTTGSTFTTNGNNYGFLLEDSIAERDCYIYSNNNTTTGIDCNNNSTLFTISFVANNNGSYGVFAHTSKMAGCTLLATFSGNGVYDIYLQSRSHTIANGLTSNNHTSNCTFQTFYTTGSDNRFGCCINS